MMFAHASLNRRLRPAVLLALAVCVPAVAQEREISKPLPAEIPGLIEGLGSSEFKIRRDASLALRRAGDPAIEPLRAALTDAKPDQKLLVESLLKELESRSFAVRMLALEKNPLASTAKGLPEWDRFSRLVGDDEDAVRRYARLARSEFELFSAAAKAARDFPRMLLDRATALHRATRPTPVQTEKWTVDSYAALLLAAGNRNTRLPGATSTLISSMLTYPEFEAAVKREDGQWLLRLVGGYIQRGRIAVYGPLKFAHRHKMPEALPLARETVRNNLRASNGIPAMMVILEAGDTNDLPLLEETFRNERAIFATPPQAPPDKRFSVLNCDLALAVALIIRKQDPRDYGFRVVDPRSVPFRFSLDTVGFRQKSDRERAFRLYRDEFGAK